MPNHIKLMLSLVVLAVAAAGYVFQSSLGQVGPKYAVAFLGAFMVVAMWVFPEVQRRPGDKV
ncbi:hypothetical protein V5F59_18330 [Xanthobacter autotrophicus DSM 431]|uniref:hypothetical protein n=1 Tax=Xanthobacter nonsaccharivorans TaxID=3119912 RepID=UPI003727B382